ncbi:MAG: DNA mismatch repair protein MutS [Defluviicoccus sp.]|nr:MAG: DNA mismatch repair protein MutS [Defluviicoccus sp.]
MAQYWAIKDQYPDCLLFYRMGDFYELFFDDAVKAAAALDIALTKRGKHEGADIPMAGVPVHSHEGYVARLIRAGFKVAVCEQTEDPTQARKRGAKAVVAREVVRVITAGTLTEDSLLDARRPNVLAALAEISGGIGLAWIDITSGTLITEAPALPDLSSVLARIEPCELLCAECWLQRPPFASSADDWQARLTPLPAGRLDEQAGRRRLCEHYGVAALDGFGAFAPAEVAAAGALLEYVHLTQKGRLPRIAPPCRQLRGAVMEIDAATRRNLELVRALDGERRGSLLAVIDRTLTGVGARLLLERLSAPSTNRQEIDARLDAVQWFAEDDATRGEVRGRLRRCPDLQRAQARLSLGRGGPRDLAAIRDSLAVAAELRVVVSGAAAADGTAGAPAALARHAEGTGEHQALIERLEAALAAELPVAARDGGFVAARFRTELDDLRRLRDEGRSLIAALQSRYAAETGIAVLKIRHNGVLGYFVEVPVKHAGRLSVAPDGPFVLRQSMAGAQRYATTELADLEARIGRAADEALAIELAVFEELTALIAAEVNGIGAAAHALAAFDLASALAEVAIAGAWTRPVLDDSCDLHVQAGRHPVVEAALAEANGGPFVGNDLTLDESRRIWLLTGPNMAGKSTFLRQNALIAVLAQTGSFVPAASTRLGIVDRLFSRVGAADDLARGRSTFMVEMVETAAILNQAGPRALVILDEIGRGTATFDGLSIAWAVVEHLHEVNRCRALFATHYHELTALAAMLSSLACHSMRVKEWRGEVVFLHEVVPGAADRSYGIHVARLAGLPAVAIERAEEVLATLSSGEQSSAVTKLAHDLPLFAAAERRAARSAPLPASPSPFEERLRGLDPDALTPRQALDLLYELKNLL